jgi:uncharacterized membrane protein YecN with MAPEG domain
MELAVPITGLYAGLQALIAFFLVFQVGQLRGKTQVSIGDGGNPQLHLAIRKHGNWAEHVPFALVLMGLLELNGGGATMLHALGVVLLIARIAHPLGLKVETISSPLRIVGAAGTGIVTIAAGIALIVKAL